MHASRQTGRSRSTSSSNSVVIPRIEINGEPTSPSASWIAPSHSSVDHGTFDFYEASGAHYGLGGNLSPSQPYRPRVALPGHGHQSSLCPQSQGETPDYEIRSTIDSLQTFTPDQSSQQTRYGIFNPPLDNQQRLSVEIPPLPTAVPNNDIRTPSSDSTDAFSFVELNCYQCQIHETRLRDIEKQNQDLETKLHDLEAERRQLVSQLKEFEQAFRQQHTTLKTSLELNEDLEQKLREREAASQSKKRGRSFKQSHASSSSAAEQQEHTVQAGVVKRARFNPYQRQQTAQTRQRGACVKCWKHKQRCEPGEGEETPCKSCRESSTGTARLPCIRTHIVDMNIFRLGTGQHDTWTLRDEVDKQIDLTTYTSDTRTVLELTHGFGPFLKVNVRPYQPVRDDVTIYEWRDALRQPCYKQMPSFAVSDIEDLKPVIASYITENQDVYIQEYLSTVDVPTWEAFEIAKKWASTGKSTLLRDALLLWTAARLIEKPWEIGGSETLGLQTDNHWTWIPITPVMDTQLDQIVIRSFLQPYRETVLRNLQVKIEKDSRKNSFEIFVCVIILLSTIEQATKHDHDFANFFGHEYSPGRKRFEDYKLVESYFHSAATLLTHAKVALEGRFPYLDATTNVSSLMNACRDDDDEKAFMINVDRYVNDTGQQTHFAHMRENCKYESSQFWTHQLFLKQWDGSPMSIREESL